MQILLVGPVPRFLGPHHAPWVAYTSRALRRLGHRPSVFPYREPWSGWGPDLQEKIRRTRDRKLLHLARRLRPEMVLILKGVTLSGEDLATLKRIARGPMVTWWVDDPWRMPQTVEKLSMFDHVFIFDRSYLPRLREIGVKQAHFLPCACDEMVYRPLPLGPSERRRFACDVSFVAWHYPGRSAMVRELAREFQVGVWGGGWQAPEIRQMFREHPGTLRGRVVNDLTAARIYNASKIGLNIHHAQTREAGLNTRTFELLASGLFQLVDQVPGMEELLTPDLEIVCYRSPGEAVQLIRRYLADSQTRYRIAARGRERVLSEHTYVHRMRSLCERAGSSSS